MVAGRHTGHHVDRLWLEVSSLFYFYNRNSIAIIRLAARSAASLVKFANWILVANSSDKANLLREW